VLVGLRSKTSLGTACKAGRVELVKLFLERGADPVEADAERWATPLAWAVRMNHPEILELLGNTALKRRINTAWDLAGGPILARLAEN
jgi:ankyrin repeat protein